MVLTFYTSEWRCHFLMKSTNWNFVAVNSKHELYICNCEVIVEYHLLFFYFIIADVGNYYIVFLFLCPVSHFGGRAH